MSFMDGIPGLSDNPIASSMRAIYGNIFPEATPQRTEMSIPLFSQSNDPTMDLFNNGVMPALAANGSAGVVPYNGVIAGNFGTMFTDPAGGNIAFIDTSQYSTMEQLADQPVDNPVLCQPYADGTQNQFGIYMPLFNLRGAYTGKNDTSRIDRAPGFHTLATHVLINQIQANLVQAERDTDMLQRTGAFRQQARGAVIYDGGREALAGDGSQAAKRRALPATSSASGYSNGRGSTNARVLKVLRELGALTAAELYKKIEFLGPIAKAEDSNNGATATAGYMALVTDRQFNYTLYSRGKIHNIFATAPREGDSLYFSVANYSRDQLQALGAATGFALMPGNSSSLKRAYGGAGFVGGAGRAAGSDEFAQVRGWADSESLHFMKPTAATEHLDALQADRFFVEREHRVALEYRKYRYNPDTDRMEPERDLVAEEGEQEALANIPDLVIEEYTSAASIIPVGRIKTPIIPRTTAAAILNAHYDHAACAAMDHFDIYQNCA